MAYRSYSADNGFDEKVLQIKRVSKKTAGGSQIAFTALVAVGDRKGQLGIGLGKSKDVQTAVRKAVTYAHRNLVQLPISGDTISHDVSAKYGAAQVLIKPAPAGSGLIAGGTVRVILDLAGVKNASAKMLGSSNKVSNARCTVLALRKLK